MYSFKFMKNNLKTNEEDPNK